MSTGLHQASGRWRLGFSLALFTAICWGALPVALRIVLAEIDAATLSWFRFVMSAGAMLTWLAAKRNLPDLRGAGRNTRWLLGIASLGLGVNYVFFQLAIPHTGAAAAQVFVQMAPVMLMAGAVVIFKESFNKAQRIGLAVMLAGFGAFLYERLGALEDLPDFGYGFGLVVIASVAWAAYAMAQKQLLMRYSSAQVMAVVYLVSAIVLTPLAHPKALLALSPSVWCLLVLSGLNTIVAYGAFAESLAHWESSRVSAVIAVTPILTLVSSEVASRAWPMAFASEHIRAASYVGAALVVVGSIVTSLARRKPNRDGRSRGGP